MAIACQLVGQYVGNNTILNDQDENNATLTTPKNKDHPVIRYILRWNCPKKFLDILKNFNATTDSDNLIEMCKKEPSFAGF